MKLSWAAGKMILVITVSSVIIIGIGAAVYGFASSLDAKGAFPFAVGVAAAAGLNVLKVFMLDRAVKTTLDMTDVNAGKSYIRIQYLLRFLLTAGVLVAAALLPDEFIDLIGACAGVLTFQIGAMSLRFFKEEDPKEGDDA